MRATEALPDKTQAVRVNFQPKLSRMDFECLRSPAQEWRVGWNKKSTADGNRTRFSLPVAIPTPGNSLPGQRDLTTRRYSQCAYNYRDGKHFALTFKGIP